MVDVEAIAIQSIHPAAVQAEILEAKDFRQDSFLYSNLSQIAQKKQQIEITGQELTKCTALAMHQFAKLISFPL